MSSSKQELNFWKKVQKSPQCHEWLRSTDHNGHGIAWFNGRLVGAHRVAWELVYGSPPNGSLLHTCDNRKCVRVDHLREGSQAENIADMVSKNRQCSGEAKHNAKLNESAVREIRGLYDTGQSYADLARQYKVHRATIRDVITGRTWKKVL